MIAFTDSWYIKDRQQELHMLLACLFPHEMLRPSLNHRLFINSVLTIFICLYKSWHYYMQLSWQFGFWCALVCRVSIKVRISASIREMRTHTLFTSREMWFWEGSFLCISVQYHRFLLLGPNLNQLSINCVLRFCRLINAV